MYKARLSSRMIMIWMVFSLLEIVLIWYLLIPRIMIGDEIDSFKGVPVYYNGIDYEQNHGQNSAPDGYYYGYKWQCVEYIKRFYYLAKGHCMPDVMGHAKEFFDPLTPHGQINMARGLVQFRNGGQEKPRVDDLVVFNDSKYGHVAIITKVNRNSVEIIQQNASQNTRQDLKLQIKSGHYYLGDGKQPVAWLRK
ncbi:MAG: CHAP domain-containing protein [Syntrophomonas sp.]|nr:CHAP domain-containing protein [Syntrophomonas sp.]